MEIRKITAAEKEQILQGYDYAFYEWQEQAHDAASLDRVEPEEILAAFIDGKVAAALRIHNFHQVIRGKVVRIGGIGGVWAYPEHRNRGLVRRLLEVAFKQMQAMGQVASMLIPFKPTFYEKFGYVVANSNLEVTLPMAVFLPYLAKGKELARSQHWQLERVNASQSWAEFLDFMYRVAPQQHHGIVIPLDMPEPQWRSRMQKRQCILIRCEGELVAAAHYAINSNFQIATDRRLLLIPDMYWSSLSARDMLFSFIARHRDQIPYVGLNLPLNSNFQPWFGDVPPTLKVSISRNPYMVRVIDLVGAVKHLPAAVAGKLTLAVSDHYCDWNEGVYQIYAQDGSLRCDRLINGNISDMVDVSASIEGISALVYGTLPLAELEHREWLKVNNPGVRNLLETWFTPMTLYNTFRF
jgi:predicted acetyltransferase